MSLEGQYEMQTILHEHPYEVTQATQLVLGEYLAQPIPDNQQPAQSSEQLSQQTQNIDESQRETQMD